MRRQRREARRLRTPGPAAIPEVWPEDNAGATREVD